MATRHLQYLFEPSSVALIGASERPGSIGAALTRRLLAGGFQGELFLVNRRHSRVQGRPAFQYLSELPRLPELAILATPTATLQDQVVELGTLGVKVVVIATPVGILDSAARSAWEKIGHPHGPRLLGPGSFGVIVPSRGFDASLGSISPRPGSLALIASSGAVLGPILEWASDQGIGFSRVVALGETVDIDSGDLLDWLAGDPETHAILLFLENLTDARKFLSAARAATRGKPVLVVRAGRGGDPNSQQVDAVYDAAFRRVGILRLQSLRELCWTANALTLNLPPTGDRLVILGNGAGLNRLAAATLLAEGGRLAQFDAETQAALRDLSSAGDAPVNPLDLGADADPIRFAAALERLLRAPDLDGILALYVPNSQVSGEDSAAALIEVARQPLDCAGPRPIVLACWLGADSARAARRRLQEARIPQFDSPEDAVRAFLRRWHRTRDQVALMETPPETPGRFDVDIAKAREIVQDIQTEGRDRLNAAETATLMSLYDLPVPQPDATITAPVAGPAPLALTIRVVTDPVFGPVLLLAPSGPDMVASGDCVAALPPLDPVLAREAIAHTRIHRLLQNAAIADPGALERVVLTLVRTAQLIVDLEEVVELELAPLWLTAGQTTLGAARIQVGTIVEPVRQRLAIRPYPRELEETLSLPDDSTVLIRPVRPEDEPSFLAGFSRLSDEEIRMRFLHAIRELTHEEAVRLTQIDYDRDMALIVLRRYPGRALEPCGVARISGDADRERAEFAIVLLREATGIGLGSLLLRRLIQYAREWGFREIFGEILRENNPMLRLCRAMDFAIQPHPDDPGMLIATLALSRTKGAAGSSDRAWKYS